MSIFGGLFGEEGDGAGSSSVRSGGTSMDEPGPPRPPHGLSGIQNLGATCYLNSLLQTLLLTPEFRDSLFCLERNERRRIPLQLQKLFARLLLLDQQSTSTTDLTNSFGWNNNEELQQHDVQELNKILFDAIEESLKLSPGHDLIKNLYNGAIVNQITCEECGRVSEREEGFRDLSVTLVAGTGLQHVLHGSYVQTESLSGDNQYQCEACNKLVNAKRGAKLRNLPPILTISLLRFNFNYEKLERYKEKGTFSFPFELNMAEYCEKAMSEELTNYELFSAVIHGGNSAHGGHYYAYIRDIDCLGTWTHPMEEKLTVRAGPDSTDFLQLDSPRDILRALLQTAKTGLSIDKLCASLSAKTGVSWKNRFKKQFGTIGSFLDANHDVFFVEPFSNIVSLQPVGESTEESSEGGNNNQAQRTKTNDSQRPVSPPPAPSHAWFKFNDTSVHPVRAADIEKHFSGKECAYMLFYRRKSLIRPPEAKNNRMYNIPDWLVKEVEDENVTLAIKREEYEKHINTVTVLVYVGSLLKHERGALQASTDMCPYIELKVDKRNTVRQFRAQVCEMCGELLENNKFVMHLVRDVPAGLHVFDRIAEPDDFPVKTTLVGNGGKLLVWDGECINGEPIPVGEEATPVFLHVHLQEGSSLSRGFPRNWTLQELTYFLAQEFGMSADQLNLVRFVTEGKDTVAKRVEKDANKTLAEVKLLDGDILTVEDNTDLKQRHSLPETQKTRDSTIISVTVENRCLENGEFKIVSVNVEKDASVGELKAIAVSQLSPLPLDEGGRLRIESDDLGLKAPLHEEQTVEEAGVRQGARLVLEGGAAPLSTQMTLKYCVTQHPVQEDFPEILVTVTVSVQECLDQLIKEAGLHNEEWHLRKTNWCGEPGEMLNDLDASLEECQVRNGDLVLVEKGKLPPKGFVKVMVWLYDYPEKKLESEGLWSSVVSSLEELQKSSSKSGGNVNCCTLPVKLGELVVSKEATLEDFKVQIRELPVINQMRLPSTDFLRVRQVDGVRPTTVLRSNSQSLQRLKVTNGCILGVQVREHAEDLSAAEVVLRVQERCPGTGEYRAAREVVWNSGGQGGTSPTGLRHFIAQQFDLPPEHTIIAKHLRDKYEWIVIKHINREKQHSGKGGGGNKKRKSLSGGKTNVRQAPYHVRDGDTIGVKDARLDGSEDFTSPDDLQGLARLQKEAEEKQRLREERKKYSGDLMNLGTGSTLNKRPEVGIKIRVD